MQRDLNWLINNIKKRDRGHLKHKDYLILHNMLRFLDFLNVIGVHYTSPQYVKGRLDTICKFKKTDSKLIP